MWLTQTYLGDVERDAKYFVYYLYEDYDHQQKALTQAIQRNLEELGDVYDDQVSLLMPNPRFAGQIESEFRKIEKLWQAVHGHLPGLLLSPVPLARLNDAYDSCLYAPLNEGDPRHLARVVHALRGQADQAIQDDLAARSTKPSLRQRIGRALELKPGIWGVKIDLKRLMSD